MAISSISPLAGNPVGSITGNSAASAAARVQSGDNQQKQPVSATVTLSVQGQQQANPAQVGQSQTGRTQTSTSNTVNTPVAPNVVPQSKETNAAPGIQFMTGESKGGHVNTYV